MCFGHLLWIRLVIKLLKFWWHNGGVLVGIQLGFYTKISFLSQNLELFQHSFIYTVLAPNIIRNYRVYVSLICD
jgi:hypothetical protein